MFTSICYYIYKFLFLPRKNYLFFYYSHFWYRSTSIWHAKLQIKYRDKTAPSHDRYIHTFDKSLELSYECQGRCIVISNLRAGSSIGVEVVKSALLVKREVGQRLAIRFTRSDCYQKKGFLCRNNAIYLTYPLISTDMKYNRSICIYISTIFYKNVSLKNYLPKDSPEFLILPVYLFSRQYFSDKTRNNNKRFASFIRGNKIILKL